jgi:hypothetical protein
MKGQLHLIPLISVVSAAEVLNISDSHRIFACDFVIAGAETFEEKPWGYESGRLVNIDHHAPTPRMRRQVSSTNLALLYVRDCGVAGVNETIVINHTDCDSVLSAAVLRGEIEPNEIFGEAAIAADHTGKENSIADLLQALDKKRDYDFSLRNLQLLLNGQDLDEEAQIALNKRLAKREKATQLIRDGIFAVENGVAWAELDEAIDGEFFPALLPETALIVMFSPRKDEPGRWDAKFRLGAAAPEQLSLIDVIQPIDKGYGGRWNAGSNKRAGGSDILPRKYAARIVMNIGNVLS